MSSFFRINSLVLFAAVVGVLAFAACDSPGANTGGNANHSNTNLTNSNSNLSNTNSVGANTNAVSSSAATAIETREPETYQATVILKLETTDAPKNADLPPITAHVARNGADRRMEFALPNGAKVIYLDAAGKHYLISPDRKQFAELNKESVGFEIRNLMSPAQIVAQVKNLKGVERVGEETVDGRSAIKYRYAGIADTKSQAGIVNTESFVLVDKETGLPLRSETNSNSQSGQVKGVSGVRLVTEMNNIQSTAAPDLFAPPKDFKQVAPEEVRSQVTAIFNIAAAVLGNVLKNTQPTTSPTP